MVKSKISEEDKLSLKISEMCSIFDKVKSEFQWYCDEVKKMEALTQDYLHSLELDGLDYKERAKLATQLALCRQRRRKCKEIVEVYEPLFNYMESDKGRQGINLLRQVLGQTRKAEERIETRQYTPRVLKGDS